MRVELMRADDLLKLENDVNDFIRDKDVVNVSISHTGSDFNGYLAYILYRI